VKNNESDHFASEVMGSIKKDTKRHASNSISTFFRSKPSPLAQFQQQRHDVNRSPVASPPIAKKFLKIKDDDNLSSLSHNSMLSLHNNNTLKGKENCSILKTKNKMDKHISRHVEFQHDIRVFNFDRVAGDLVGIESQSLCSQPKDRKVFLNRTLQRKNKIVLNDSNSTVLESKAEESGQSVDLQTTKLSIDTVKTVSLENIDFTYVEDETHRLWVKCIVTLGGHVSVEDILVRANTSGNKIRIVGCRTIGSVRQDFNERYNLPMDVDPYLISARMDPMSGKLLVEAPVRIE
jgi:hypothetical protein